MMNVQLKEDFLKNEYIEILYGLNPNSERKWGKMNVQQMIEHMADSFRMGNGKDLYTGILTPEERIEKVQAFIMSDRPFKENTKNLLMNEEPLPTRHSQVEASIAEIRKEIEDFFGFWKGREDQVLRNPFFGDLDYVHWVNLLYKHCWHHLRQFGLQSPYDSSGDI